MTFLVAKVHIFKHWCNILAVFSHLFSVNLLNFLFCLGKFVLAEGDELLRFLKLCGQFVNVILVGFHFVNDRLQLNESFFIFQIIHRVMVLSKLVGWVGDC